MYHPHIVSRTSGAVKDCWALSPVFSITKFAIVKDTGESIAVPKSAGILILRKQSMWPSGRIPLKALTTDNDQSCLNLTCCPLPFYKANCQNYFYSA